jgi:hypothetical protein
MPVGAAAIPIFLVGIPHSSSRSIYNIFPSRYSSAFSFSSHPALVVPQFRNNYKSSTFNSVAQCLLPKAHRKLSTIRSYRPISWTRSLTAQFCCTLVRRTVPCAGGAILLTLALFLQTDTSSMKSLHQHVFLMTSCASPH